MRLSILVLAGWCIGAYGAELTTLEGKKATGEVMAIGKLELTFQVNGMPQKYPLTELNTVEFGNKPKPIPANATYTMVELTDGTTIRCTSFKLDGKTAILEVPDFAAGTTSRMQVPMTTIFTVLKEAQDLRRELRFRELIRSRGRFDLWVISKPGAMENKETYDAIPGTFGPGDLEKNSIKFTRQGANPLDLPIDRIAGMIFNQLPGEAPPTICTVQDSLGNNYAAKSVERTANGFTVNTVAGLKLEMASNQISKFDFGSNSVKYLSEMEYKLAYESSVLPIELLKVFKNEFPDRKGLELYVDAKTLKKVTYRKGLWVHPDVILEFPLERKFKTFRASVGIDPRYYGNSDVSINLVVEGDGTPLLRNEIKAGSPITEINVNLQNCDLLRIRVETPKGELDAGRALVIGDGKVMK
ncbi:MAG: NPCBM/NEW2 domain-containing protein [Zavarzinella sp.]